MYILEWTEVFSRMNNVPNSRDNVVWSFFNWGDKFKIEFDLMVNSELTATWHNVFHITKDKNCCGNGRRIPAVWLNKNKSVYISSSVNGKGNHIPILFESRCLEQHEENQPVSTLERIAVVEGYKGVRYIVHGK